MKENKNSRSMGDLVDGKDYLVNYYQFFEVEPEALAGANRETAKQVLKSSHREKSLQYHPDRYAHLSPLMQSQAEQVYGSVERGYAILIDPDKRVAYDKQLADWKGPISDNGFPIYAADFYNRVHSSSPITEETFDSLREMSHIVGFNPNTHKLLERLHQAGGEGDEQLEEELDRSLNNMDLFAGVEEHFRWEQAGVEGHEFTENTPAGYLEAVKEKIDVAKNQVFERVNQLLLEARSGQLLLVDANRENITEQALMTPEETAERFRAAFTEAISTAEPKLEALAQKREEILAKRIKLSMRYQPAQPQLFGRVAVCVNSSRGILWQAYRLEQTNIVSDDSLTAQEMSELSDPTKAEALIAQEWNILIMKVREHLDIHLQLREVLTVHFENFLDQKQSEES